MAHQFPAQHQAHPGQMPPHQNIGQQRHNPMAQQHPVAQHNPMTQQQGLMGQQRGLQNSNTLQTGYTKYDPQLALFTFERQKGAEGWEDVEPEQQHVNAQDLQSDVKKFQRSKTTVKRVMEDIPSTNARRLVNELVEEQNQALMAINRTLRWTIASIDIKWKTIDRKRRQLQRISVILQTEPSGYEDPHTVRAAAGVGSKVQPMQQPMQPNQGFPQQSNHTGNEMPQLQRNPQHPAQPPMAHMQQPAQQTRPPPPHGQAQHGQVPPPPPPPPGMDSFPPPPPGAPHSHPPPPPHGMGRGIPRPPIHGQQQPRSMPGAFPPEGVHRPPMRPSQPPVEILRPSEYKKQKKHKNYSDESSSDSESDSDEWESEIGDSGSDRFRIRHVEHGDFAHVGKPNRGRSRQSSRSKKSRHNKSRSKVRSRSRSHARTDAHRKRRDSDYIERPPMGKPSPMSNKDSSPRSSEQRLPPIHIHMNAPAAEKTTRANDRAPRDSFSASSPDHRKQKFSEPMSRENSWDRHSGTASFNDNSSIHTADDSVFSEPERRSRMHRSDIVEHPPKLRSRNLPPRQDSFGYPHTSHIYGDVEPRARRTAYPTPNDYPYQRDSYFDDAYNTPRPGLNRRNSVQTPQSNPFDTARYPPRLPRSSTLNESLYAQREPRFLDDRAAAEDVNMAELADALNHIREQKSRRPLHGHTRRASEYERERMGAYAGGYDVYDRRGY